MLSAKTENEVRSRLIDRQGERLQATEPETFEGSGAAPPGTPPPLATRMADPTEPRPAGGVFDKDEQIVDKWREVRTPLPLNVSARRKDVIRGYRRELSKLGLLNAKTEGDVRNRLMDRQGERLRASEPETFEGTAAPPGAPPPAATRMADLIEPHLEGGVFDKDEQIVNKWREVRKPLPVNASTLRKDVIRGYRRELSKLGLLNAKTEADVRNRLMDRQGERLQATEPEIIEGTGAAPPGAPPPSATRMADLSKPRPAGEVFDSEGSATMAGEVRSLGGARRMPTRVRDKAGGAESASSNDTHGAPSGAVFDSGEPSARPTKHEPVSAVVGGAGPTVAGAGGPGIFKNVSESMSAASAAYQARVTGSKAGGAYLVNGVKFDGFANGVLIDAKGRYTRFIKDGKFRKWFRGKYGFIKQAERQLAAANGTPIQWRFAEETAANATRTWFEEKEIFGIDIVHVP
jgi:hypothetical protein